MLVMFVCYLGLPGMKLELELAVGFISKTISRFVVYNLYNLANVYALGGGVFLFFTLM